jgi:hypothetical protein
MWRLLVIALLAACQPKQPIAPSFFTQARAPGDKLTCRETLDCYDACNPRVEECLLRCDQQAAEPAVERARAVENCGARNACTDPLCEQERCGPELEACTAPVVAPPPSPMQPQPYPGQTAP